MDRIAYMDMLHPRSHFAVMATEERVRSRLRERVFKAERTEQMPTPAREHGLRWFVSSLVDLFTAIRFVGGGPRPQEE